MLIVIVGVSQVGKITVGWILAIKLNYKFLDLDEIIFNEYKSIENFNRLIEIEK